MIVLLIGLIIIPLFGSYIKTQEKPGSYKIAVDVSRENTYNQQ